MPRTTYVILAIITLFTQAFTPATSLYTTDASTPQYIHASPSLHQPAPWSVNGVIDGLSSRSDIVKGYVEAEAPGGVVGVMAAPDYTTEPDTPNPIVVDQAGRVTQHRARIDGEVILDVESSEGVLYAAGTQTYSSPRHDLVIYRHRGNGWEKTRIHPDPEGDVGINIKILVYGDVFLVGYDVMINGSKKTVMAAYSYNGDTCTLIRRRVVDRKPWLLLRYGGKAMFVRTLYGSSLCSITVEVLSPASGAVVDTRTHTVERDAHVFPIKSLEDSLVTFGYVVWDGYEIHVYDPSTATWRTHSVANPIHMIMGGSRRGRYYVVVYDTCSSRRFLDTVGVEG